ncbi:MAG: hypothetical protein AAF916_12610, partial [Planctomycetota bacterium]
ELSGFSPEIFEDRFDVHTVDDSGLSSVTESLATHGGLSFSLGADSVQFVVFSERRVGDYNGDGSVDAGDYTVWRDTLGSTTDLAADGDGDAEITLADYGVWQTNYAPAGSSMGIAAPEASTLVGGVLCLLLPAATAGSRSA